MSVATKDIGQETLDRIGDSLGRYNRWLFEQLAPQIRGRVLEVGSGIGNLSLFLFEHDEVHLSDASEEYLAILRSRFGDRPNVWLHKWDLRSEPPTTLEPRCFDTIVCSNVLEHVANDAAALDRMHRLLAADGCLVLLVPAHQLLYNNFDRGLGHFRRYNRTGLRVLLTEAGFDVRRIWYFNALGILGWYVNGTLLKEDVLPVGQMRIFDWLVPVLRVEQWLHLPFGVSVIAVARKSRD